MILWFDIKVRQIVSIVLLLVFSTSSLTQAGGAVSSVSQRVTIQISHSHAHSHSHDSEDDHHDHDSPVVQSEESGAGSSVASEPTSHDQSGDRHTHSIVIATSIAIALPQKLTMAFDLNLIAVPPIPKEVDPPGDLSLGSIFRPPISA